MSNAPYTSLLLVYKLSQLVDNDHTSLSSLSLLPTESFLRELQQYEVVHPSRVDAKGHFLSNFLFHHAGRIQRREAPGDLGSLTRVFYQLQHDGHNLHFNLTLNPHLLAPGFLTERRYGGLEGAKIRGQGSLLCHLSGDVWDEASVKGSAAISTCNGLVSLCTD